jgi:hypothetical protein
VGWVDPGATLRYSFTVSVAASLADGALLQALATLFDGSTSLVRSSTSTEVDTSSALTLGVTVSPNPVAPNALSTYTFVVTNTGASTYTNLALSDLTFGPAVAYVSQMTGGGACGAGTYCSSGMIVTWPSFTLAPGESKTVTRTDTTSGGVANGTLLHNQARLSSPSGTLTKSTDISVHQ